MSVPAELEVWRQVPALEAFAELGDGHWPADVANKHKWIFPVQAALGRGRGVQGRGLSGRGALHGRERRRDTSRLCARPTSIACGASSD